MDAVYEGETLIIPRNGGRNVVVISEEAYNKMGGVPSGEYRCKVPVQPDVSMI